MSVLRPRNRLVNFRLSEDEFEKLKTSCSTLGARSVSDFARSAVLDRMDQPVGQETSRTRIQHLDGKVFELELRVGQLLGLLQSTGHPGPSIAALPEFHGTALRADAAHMP